MIDLNPVVVAGNPFGRDQFVGVEAAAVLFLPQFIAEQFPATDRATKQIGYFPPGFVPLLVPVVDATGNFIAFLRAFADVPCQLDMDRVRQPVSLDDGANLFQHFSDGLAGHRVANVIQVRFDSGGVVVSDVFAGLRIDLPLL